MTKWFTQSIFRYCVGIVPKMKSLQSSNLEIWNYLNNGGFSLQMGAHNYFARIDKDQVIEKKGSKSTKSLLGQKAAVLYQVQWYTTRLLQAADDFNFFGCLEK